MHNKSNNWAIHNITEKSSPIQRLIYGCLFPIMIVQGIWVRITVPKLAEARGRREGITGSGMPLRILVAGDSSAAGVGASTQTDALVGQLVSPLTDDFKVYWKLIANTGWTTAELRKFLNTMPSTQYDIALTATGVNDITSRHSMPACLLEQVKLVDLLRDRFKVRHILISGLPPVHRFPSLPKPLRCYIGGRAKRLDVAIQFWIRNQPDCDHIQLSFPVGPENMASDGFHPGPGIYAFFRKSLIIVEGELKQFDEKKGFGFISTEEHDDVFVHYTGIDGSGFIVNNL